MDDDAAPQITWLDDSGQAQQAPWRSLAGHPPPREVVLADDRLSADAAYRLARQGTGLLWRGDYQNARHLLAALMRRVDAAENKAQRSRGSVSANGAPAKPAAAPPALPAATPPTMPPIALAAAFAAQRQHQADRARIGGQLLLPFNADHSLPLRRAPDVRAAAAAAHGPVASHYVASLRELLGLVGAFEWRKKGVPVPALGSTIHPYHGVFSPVRGEYVDLVATTPLPAVALAQVCELAPVAFDIGTGTGVLAAVLARRGLAVVATDVSGAALACAADNLGRLGLAASVTLLAADLFPPGRAALVVCNPPWVPARAESALEAAVYDPDSRMLCSFLAGVAAHLVPAGEAWLILSDLAEHLGLRPRDQLLGWIAAAGLHVLGRVDVRPRHRRASDAADPLHAARSAEVTSLWRLGLGPR